MGTDEIPAGKSAESMAAEESAKWAAIDVHRRAIMKLPTTVDPQSASSLQSTENAWRRMVDEFGSLSATEVAVLLRPGVSSSRIATQLRTSGGIIGVKRLHHYEFPGFQFDWSSRQVLPVIEPLISLADKHNWDHHDLVLWLMSPSCYFEDELPPVRHLDAANLVEIFENVASDEW